MQHAHGLVVVKDVQDRVFPAGRVSQFGQDAWWHQLGLRLNSAAPQPIQCVALVSPKEQGRWTQVPGTSDRGSTAAQPGGLQGGPTLAGPVSGK